MTVFWAQGYEATTMDDLVAATGLSVSSIYAAFGDKHGLFQAALARYEDHMTAALGRLVGGSRGLGDVVDFVDRIRSDFVSGDRPPGCLMVNTMVELEASDEVIGAVSAQYRSRVHDALRQTLLRAEALGQMPERTATPRARMVLAVLFGALVTARAGHCDEADAMLRSLKAELRRWQR
ncbi:MAG: TetR/AcrR family transcriptional regulator [Acidimicrobiia bacterium]